MSRKLRKWGIAGHPRGATHYAARLFDIGHEGMSSNGCCDFILAAPTLPPKHLFDRWMHPFHFADGSWLDRFEFENRLTVVREPWRVLASAFAIRPGDFAPGMAWCLGKEVKVNQGVTLDYVADVMVGWYRFCLDYSGGDFFRGEDPKGHLPWLPANTTLPPPGLRGGRRGPLKPPTAEEYREKLEPANWDAVAKLQEDLGYE